MSWLSQILKQKAGLPEIDFLKRPETAPFLRPLADGITRENLKKALPLLDDATLKVVAEEVARDLDRREGVL